MNLSVIGGLGLMFRSGDIETVLPANGIPPPHTERKTYLKAFWHFNSNSKAKKYLVAGLDDQGLTHPRKWRLLTPF